MPPPSVHLILPGLGSCSFTVGHAYPRCKGCGGLLWVGAVRRVHFAACVACNRVNESRLADNPDDRHLIDVLASAQK